MNNTMQNTMNNTMQNINYPQHTMVSTMAHQQFIPTMNQQSGQQSLVSKLFEDSGNIGSSQSVGTSIADLKQKQSDYSIQQKQFKKQNDEKQVFSNSDQERDKIKHLVKDINKSLDDYGPSKMRNSDESYDVTDNDNDNNNDNENESENREMFDDKYEKIFPDYLTELLLIVIIYVILSQNFVRKIIGNYISYINPEKNGTVPLIGYIIYGTIIAVMFELLKKIFIK